MEGSIEQLLSVDPAALTLDDQLDHLILLQSLAARVSARTQRYLAAVADPGDQHNWIREEVACLLRWSFGTTAGRLIQAENVVRRLPAALDAHEAGLISDYHLRILFDLTHHLDDAQIAKVEAQVLERAGDQTPSEFRAAVKRAVARVDTRAAEERHAAAHKQRAISLHPLADGMAGIWSVHNAVDAEAMMARLHQFAGSTAAPGDERTIDQREADALVDCVLGTRDQGAGAPARRAAVQIVIPYDVAAGRSDLPGELIGYGPIPAALCRDVLADPSTTVERIHLDADGTVIPDDDVDDTPTRYRPTARLWRYVVTQHRTCRFPGCRRRATRCELDHIEPYDGTNTVKANLQPLCSRHHHCKHDGGWTVHRRPDGTTEWISPTGRTYEKPPDDWPDTDDDDPPS